MSQATFTPTEESKLDGIEAQADLTPLDDGTIAGQIAYWNGSKWTPITGISVGANTQASPLLAIGDGDTGFYESADDTLVFVVGTEQIFSISKYKLIMSGSGSFPLIKRESPSSSSPVFVPYAGDTDTGVGWNAANELSLIAGGIEVKRVADWMNKALADDAEVALTTGVAGYSTVQLGDDEAFASFAFKTDGTIRLRETNGSVATADTDGNLCIYYSTGTIRIKNRLGSSKKARIDIIFSA